MKTCSLRKLRRGVMIAATATAAAATLLLSEPASAHVTVQPDEAVVGSFARFVVRVPNERDDAATTKVEVQLPEDLVSVSFQPKSGWTRTVERKQRAQAVEVFGEQVTDYIAAVTWEGGRIEPGEFEEFGFSARVPTAATTLPFPANQTYSSGEVVRWIGPPDSEEPAARVSTVKLGPGEEQPGELTALSRLTTAGGDDGRGDDAEDDDDANRGMILGAIGAASGLVALGVALMRRR